MPALFAYLIAVGLLLGGGYGALSWLAAPEPIKVVAKAKPKPPPRYETSQEISSSEANPLSINYRDHAASDSNVQPLSPQTESVESSGQGTPALVSAPARDQPNRSADVEVSQPDFRRAEASPVDDATPGATHPAQAVSSNRLQGAVSFAPAAVAKPVKRTLRQASKHSEKPALALMTLRTIEFPDGRRVTQLIPYRNGERALAD
jgi:hypothetical protein